VSSTMTQDALYTRQPDIPYAPSTRSTRYDRWLMYTALARKRSIHVLHSTRAARLPISDVTDEESQRAVQCIDCPKSHFIPRSPAGIEHPDPKHAARKPSRAPAPRRRRDALWRLDPQSQPRQHTLPQTREQTHVVVPPATAADVRHGTTSIEAPAHIAGRAALCIRGRQQKHTSTLVKIRTRLPSKSGCVAARTAGAATSAPRKSDRSVVRMLFVIWGAGAACRVSARSALA
jgi:hypothetical protein